MIPGLTVDVLWDDEAGVYVAVSDDVIGLAVEGATFEALVENVMGAVPALIAANGLPRRVKTRFLRRGRSLPKVRRRMNVEFNLPLGRRVTSGPIQLAH